jgi:hypothetical protein
MTETGGLPKQEVSKGCVDIATSETNTMARFRFSRPPLLRSFACFVVGVPLFAACSEELDSSEKVSSAQSAGSAEPTPTPSGTVYPDTTGTASAPPRPVPAPEPMDPDAALADIQARCANAAHGPADPYASFAELKTRVHGRWFACNRADTSGLYAKESAIQFAATGAWNLLHQESDGTFTTLHGVANEGTWGEKYTDFTGYLQVDWPNGANDMVLTAFDFETSPTRMRIRVDGGAPIWFVPMND